MTTSNSSWETFKPVDLRKYLSEGVQMAVTYIERIAYLDQPYTKQDEKNLNFMVEALLQARRTTDEAGHEC